MHIAFYAPLKPPTHPRPSGDRRMARLLMAALKRAGHEVTLASRLRGYDRTGEALNQARIRARGEAAARRLLARYRALPRAERPALWFTYHPYYKAPDWLGPSVADALGIPYVVAEASHAPKRAGGPWAHGHAASEAAIRRADAIMVLNPADRGCLSALLGGDERLHALPPFLDAAAYAPPPSRAALRAATARRYSLGPDRVWLLSVAMMRAAEKLESYRLLASALARIADPSWQLLIVGGGEAQAQVRAAFAGFASDRVVFAGTLAPDRLPELYAGADIFAWPSVGEAYGMALLEAQASGLPAVAGAYGGVGQLIADGRTGFLTPPGDVVAFAAALAELIAQPARRAAMATAARARVLAGHDIVAASRLLDDVVRQAVAHQAVTHQAGERHGSA